MCSSDLARSVDPGYQRDHILQVDNLGRYQLQTLGDTIAQQVKQVDGVVSVGRTQIGVSTDNNNNTGLLVPGRTDPIPMGQYRVDTGFLEAMGLKLAAGRWFDPSRPMDDMTTPFPSDPAAEKAIATRGVNVVFNELGVRKLGDRKSTRLNSSHVVTSRMPSSA